MEVEGFKPPQEEVIPIRRSAMTHRAPDQLYLNIEVEEHSLEDLNEPNNYKATISDVGNKIHKAFPLPVIEFPLPEKVPTASEESCHYQKKRDAIAVTIELLLKSRRNCQSKSNDSYAMLVPYVTPCILGITIIVTSCTRTPCPIKGVL
nr:zinc finger, CCHC-type [Tanacetum cinerariifolium]